MTLDKRRYRYRAATRDGEIVEGAVEASSSAAALDSLWARGLTPFEARAADDAPWWRRELFATHGVGPQALAAFTRELATLAKAGIALDDVLRIMIDQADKKDPARSALGGLLENVLEGDALSVAMARQGAVFGKDYVDVVQAGEASGRLPQALSELSELLDQRLELSARIRGAMIYPSILMIVALGSVGVVIGVLVPNIAPVFAENGKEPPAFVSFLLALRTNWRGAIALGAGCSLGLGALIVILRRRPHLRARFDRLLLELPFFGLYLTQAQYARFARTLGTLLRAGVPMLAAASSATQSVANAHLRSGFEGAVEALRGGDSLAQAIAANLDPPALALRMVAVGEETGKLDAMLLRLAGIFEDLGRRKIERAMTLLTPAMTLLISGFVGVLIFSVMTAILSVYELAVQ